MIKIEATSINVCKALLVLISCDVKARITDSDITIEGDVTPSVIRKLDLDILRVKKFDGSFDFERLEEEIEAEEACKNVAEKEDAMKSSVISIPDAKIFMSSGISKQELFEICYKSLNNSTKIKDILEVFGFHMGKNGTRYLSLAILTSLMLPDTSLTSLCKEVVRAGYFNDVPAEEVERVIALRVKENFRTKKSLASEFIRFVKYLIITKGGILNEIS